MAITVSYLGPSGTFCEQAAQQFVRGQPAQLLPGASLEEVFATVDDGRAELGVVPIENSYEGPVSRTLDLLAGCHSLQLAGEITLPVQQHLLTRPGVAVEGITHVLSHPQALAQCRQYLARVLPKAELVTVASTAEGARLVSAARGPSAAIGPQRLAAIYQLTIAARAINDQLNNATRFVVLARQEGQPHGDCQTTLLVRLPNRDGVLYRLFESLHVHDVHPVRIEPRPAGTVIGEYQFFIDIKGHRREEKVSAAIDRLKEQALAVTILGSYPVSHGQA